MSDTDEPRDEPGSTGWRSARRGIWQPPARSRDRRRRPRRVEFLELFFDLVFVVLVAQLAHRLAGHPSWSGFGWFCLLFYAVWSSWLNGTFYHDAHGTDDLSIRVLTFGLMITVAVMAVFAGTVPGDGAAGFAIGYAANSVFLAVMLFRTGYHDREQRRSSSPMVAAYSIGAVVFFTSAFVPARMSYSLWVVALLIEAVGVMPSIRRRRADVDEGIATASLIERFGLLIIIVLGEVVAGAINGMASSDPIDGGVIAVGILGMVVAIGLWWIYFDLIAHRPPRRNLEFAWGYLHFPLAVGIAAAGAGVLAMIEHVGEPVPAAVRWLLLGSTALALVAIVAVAATLVPQPENRRIHTIATYSVAVSAALILIAGFTSLAAIGTMALLSLLLLAPVAFSVFVWARSTEFT